MNTNNTNNKNVLQGLESSISYFIIGILLFMIIGLFMILFKVNIPFKKPSKSQQEEVSDIFIILFFCLLVFSICVLLLPSFKDIRSLLQQISNVTYVIIYTIFLILFLTMMPKDIINNYSYIITPITILLGAFMFYKSLNTNYLLEFNVNYERIKTMILFFCLITILITYYNVDPGGYIQKNFGYSLLITILLSVFAFLYLIIVLTLTDDSKTTNILSRFPIISTCVSIGFLLFIIFIAVFIARYPGGFFNNKEQSSSAMILILLICILFSILLGAYAFPEISNNLPINDKTNLFKRSLLALFGIVISSLLIYWIVYNIQNLSGTSSIIRFILNILIVIIVLGLIYKTINVNLPKGNSNKNAFFSLLANTLFYIPCLFTGLFDSLGNFIGKGTLGTNSEIIGSSLMILVLLILSFAYFGSSTIINAFNIQGGKQLVNKPVYTDTKYALGNYIELNGSDNPDYQYGISCWVFIDAMPPNTNSSYNKFTSLLNFANKPNILYNASTNTLMITSDQKNLKEVTKNKLIDFDENDNRIIYKNPNFLLQKWNNIIINYNGGVLDIFLNGDLVKSDIGVVPYMNYDNLTIGEDNGIKGGICNVVYFNRALNNANIYYLYNMVKDKTPPVLNESTVTIVKQNISTLGSSSKVVSSHIKI